MDRYEYKVREEEIRNLIAERDFAAAVKIADTIDWSRVKNVSMLCKISDLYKANRRYQEAKEILLMAYDRYPGNRRIVYALCDLSIRLDEFVQALEYYKEYVQLAPRSTDKYILQYKIFEAQDVSLEERAAVLEELKSRDYLPKWGYELAYLYHRMGLGMKCADECDELIVTFGEGKYVIKAMELKALHEPLTNDEKTRYDQYITSRDEHIVSGEPQEPAPDDDSITDMGNSTLDEDDIKGAPTSELPQDMDIEVKPVDVGQYNTINLQAALAESMKELWDDGDPDSRLMPSTPEPDIEDNTIFSVSPLAQQPAQTAAPDPGIAQTVIPDPGIAQTVLAEPEPAVTPAITPVTAPEPEEKPVRRVKELSPTLKPMPAPEPAVNPLLAEATKRIPTEAVVDYLETQKLVQEIQESTASMQAADAQAQKIPGAITGQLDPASVSAGMYDQMLMEEYSGQIRLAISEAEKIEKQITGQLSIDDVLSDWEEAKRANEKKRKEEVRTRILQHTGSLFDEFDEDTKNALIEELEKAFRDVILKTSAGSEMDEAALGRRIRKEALRTVEYMSESGEEESDPAIQRTVDPYADVADIIGDSSSEPESVSDVLPAAEPEAADVSDEESADRAVSEAETDVEAASEPDEESDEEPEEQPAAGPEAADVSDEEPADQAAAEPEAEAASEPDEESDEEPEAQAAAEPEADEASDEEPKAKKPAKKAETDEIAVTAVEEALREDERERTSRKEPEAIAVETTEAPHPERSTGAHHELSPEEEELFKAYLDRRGARKQITSALDHMSMAAYTGNVIVTGGEGVGTLDLAKRLIKYMQSTDSNFLGNQVARISGKNLNDKNLPEMLAKLNGGAIIIQSARGMKKSTVQKLMAALDNENLGILAILEDTSDGMNKIVGTLPKLGEIFNVRIDLQALDDQALVTYACEYALSQEHSIDEFALLALHTRIAELQTSAHQVSVSEVRDLVDDAIFYADKKNPAHLFDIILHKRYDDEDMVILREKDFMHY